MSKLTHWVFLVALSIGSGQAHAHQEIILSDSNLNRVVQWLGEECYSEISIAVSMFGRLVITAFGAGNTAREIVIHANTGRVLRDQTYRVDNLEDIPELADHDLVPDQETTASDLTDADKLIGRPFLRHLRNQGDHRHTVALDPHCKSPVE